jgi:hypothetical protein
MVSIDEGMQIVANDEQCRKTDSPRTEIWQPCANVTVESLVQRAKQLFAIPFSDDGTKNVVSEEHQ